MNFFKTTLASVLGSILGAILLIILMFIIFGGLFGGKGKEMVAKENSILKLDISGQISEKSRGFDFELPVGSPFGDMSATGLWEIREAIDKAKRDDHIKGIYFSPSGMSGGWATMKSIRDALIDFKSSGKFIYAYADVWTEGSYYLASVADKVYMHPEGAMEFNGLSAQPMFYKGLLDKLGVEPRIFKVGTFKSAVEPFFRTEMSEPNRLQVQTYLNDLWKTYTDGLTDSRKTQAESLNNLANSLATFNDPQAAVDAGLIDKLAYKDEMIEELKALVGAKTSKDISMYGFKKYMKFLDLKREPNKAKSRLAVIFAEGQIVDGKGSDEQIGGATLSAQIRKAREDSTVKAVVLRVNSPGGSALASDVIWREVILTKKEKPVIVSMGDVAASGGYYISAAADRIYAEPNTITGSIGVFGVLMGTGQALEKNLGLTFDRVNTHQYSDFGNPNREMTETEADAIQSSVERVYSTFINVVKEGRGFPDSVAVDSIAQGRVWSGTRARTIGLVDEIGSLQDAITYAATEANLGEDYKLMLLPEKKDPFEEFLKSLGEAKISLSVLAPEFREEFAAFFEVKNLFSKNGVFAIMPYNLNIQ